MSNNEHICILNFRGDPNIGLYGLATDRYCLVGRNVSEKQIRELKKKLKVPVFQQTLYGTDLVGLFAIGNSSTLLLPSIVFENELKQIAEALDKLDVKVVTFETRHTALGNNILLNDKIAIASPVYGKREIKMLEKALGKEIEQFGLANTSVPGSLGKITNKGGVFSPNITESEIKKLEKLLGFEIGLGTVNLGNPFISSGIFANSFGFAIGSMSSGFEISRVDESLGFLQ